MGRWALGAVALVLLFWLPLNQWTAYNEVIDQSNNRAARLRWEEVLAAGPPADAILVSNDRNEIVPLFYLQSVENRATGMTGLFPLIAPEPRFTDIGATVETALRDGDEQPVVLIKAMPGLETKFTLENLTEPLVRVAGLAAEDRMPAVPIDAPYGPLTLVGYDWQVGGEELEVTLYWQVNDALDADYTTTVQLFDGDGEKVAQDDRSPGGDYYPTALWKPGEILLDYHLLPLSEDAEPEKMLVGMYTGADFVPLADFLQLEVSALD